MQDTVRFPQVWPVYSGPAGLPLLRIGRVIGKIAVAPKGVPSSLSDHVGIIPSGVRRSPSRKGIVRHRGI